MFFCPMHGSKLLSMLKYSFLRRLPMHYENKAIRDGKYLARPMPVLGNVHPIKIVFF